MLSKITKEAIWMDAHYHSGNNCVAFDLDSCICFCFLLFHEEKQALVHKSVNGLMLMVWRGLDTQQI